jgi:hypothetical protein
MRQQVQVSNLSPEINTRIQTIYIPVTSNGTYPVVLKAGLRLRFVGATYTTLAGQCVLGFKIGATAGGATNVPSMTGLNCNSAANNTQISTGDNDTNILDFTESMWIDVTSASSLNTIVLNLYFRQIASTGGGTGGTDPQGCEFVFPNVQGTGNPANPGSGGGGGTTVFTQAVNITITEW